MNLLIRRSKYRNTEKTFQNAGMLLNLITLTVCARTAIMQRAAQRELRCVNIKKGSSMLKEYAKIATWAHTTSQKGTLAKQVTKNP